jgi:hypothetical protein
MSWIAGWLGRLLRGDIERKIDEIRLAMGRIESRRARSISCSGLRDAEFRVFSQWGEDGIIQYLLGRVAIPNPLFVEFGVGDYSESNTRFLLCNDNWRGLIIDSGRAHQRFLADREIDWRYDITALSTFITRDNIDPLIAGAGISGDIGLLSVDIDGNDYWVLDAITSVSPRILVAEYNATFGPEHSVTVPYRPDFDRNRSHSSGIYYGASLQALCLLARRKGFAFVGCNSAGNNAFFVRRDVLGAIEEADPRDGFVMNRFRESRDPTGRLSFVADAGARLSVIADLEVVETTTGRSRAIRDVFRLSR